MSCLQLLQPAVHPHQYKKGQLAREGVLVAFRARSMPRSIDLRTAQREKSRAVSLGLT